MSDNVGQFQKQRDAAFRKAKRLKYPANWISYKWLRNRNQQEVRNPKIRFYYSSFSNPRQSTKFLWSKVKELGIGKPNTESAVNMDLNTINNYFVNIPKESWSSELCR